MEIFISLSALIVSIALFKFSIGSFSLNRLSMISYLFYFKIILITYIGVIAVLLHWDVKYDTYFFAITYAVSDESRIYGWYATMYTIIVLPIGMILANILFVKRFNASPYIRLYQKKPIVPLYHNDKKEKILYFSLIIFTIISTLSVAYVFFIIQTFPLLSVFSGEDSLILRQLRGAAKLDFQGIVAIRDMIALTLTPFLSYIAYIVYKQTNLRKFKVLFYYLLILSILILTYNTEKAPVLFYGMSFLFLKVYLGITINIRKLLFYGVIVLILLVLMYFAVSGLDNLSDILDLLLARIFVAQTSAIFLAYEYFPQIHNFIGWSGVSNFFASFSAENTISSGRVIFSIYAPQSIANGTAGYIVGLFTAEAWMLFGIYGVIFSPLWVGFFIQSIHLLIIKRPKNAILLAAYMYTMMHWSLTGGLATFLYPIVMLIFFIQLYGIYLVAKVIKKIAWTGKE